ncbi:hypothetical protein DFJ74DRAFT_304693 [Hyaloraphidium curvatum]|nr:hypothetical protein DFJ74DRAFT_304693 [Hyaloraphidium curvatum]
MLHADKTAGGAQGQLHALARIKLAELGRQRGALRSHFERARAEASEKDSPAEKLRVLSDALTSADAAFASGTARGGAAGSTGVLSVGDHANLKSFVDQATQFPATVAPATVAGWVAKLEKDIDKSLKRADMAWLFGKVLEEWVSANGGDDSEAEEESDDWLMMEDPAVMADRDAFVRDKVHGLLLKIPEAPTPGVKAHLDSIFAPFASQLEDIRKQVAAFCTRPPSSSSSPLGPTTNNGGLYAPVSPAELRSALAAVLRDNLLGPAGRAQLRAIQASEDLATEYATVLTIRMLAGVEAWDWDPEAPPKLELHVNKALKIRPFVVPPDPLTALYHQIVGARLGVRAKGLLEKLWSAVEEKVKKDNYPDLTNSWAPYQSVAQGRNVLGGFLFCASLPDNVEMQEHTTGYGGSSAPQYLSKKQALLHWMLAEIGFAKYGPAENPDSDAKGVLVKGDVADFYLSIEVDVCLSGEGFRFRRNFSIAPDAEGGTKCSNSSVFPPTCWTFSGASSLLPSSSRIPAPVQSRCKKWHGESPSPIPSPASPRSSSSSAPTLPSARPAGAGTSSSRAGSWTMCTSSHPHPRTPAWPGRPGRHPWPGSGCGRTRTSAVPPRSPAIRRRWFANTGFLRGR